MAKRTEHVECSRRREDTVRVITEKADLDNVRFKLTLASRNVHDNMRRGGDTEFRWEANQIRVHRDQDE